MGTMFDIDRTERMNELNWAPEEKGIYSIETVPESSRARGSHRPITLRHDFIKEGDVEQWLTQTSPIPPTGPSFRILCISKPKKHQSAQLSISKDVFCKVEDGFRLSRVTIPSLFNASGVFSRFTEYCPTTRRAKLIRIVVKSKQKVGVGNWQISLCHDYQTNRTDALICGEGILASDPNVAHESQAVKFAEYLAQTTHLWHNPLLMPVLLLRIFCERISVNRIKVADKLVDLENAMGVTSAGRSKAKRSLDTWPQDLDVKQITIDLNSTGASILYLSQTCIWAQECIAFLIKVCDEVAASGHDLWTGSMELKETLEYEASALDGVSLTMKTKKERVQAQLNVLFSAASQKENAIALSYSRMAQEHNELAQKDVQLNTRIATSTKSDSVAMTTFTFITALFLPGTYIASLFSMSMFDWLHDATDNTRISPLFWIYWCATIPLTLVVLFGWWLWYRRADTQWMRDTGYSLSGTNLAESASSNTSHVVVEVKGP